MAVYWRDAFLYIDSDIYALSFILLAAAFFLKGFSTSEKQLVRCIVFSCLAGICSYFAYNIRTIYLFSMLLFGVLFLLLRLKQPIMCISGVAAFCLGIVIGAIPQIIVNYQHLHTFQLMLDTGGGGGQSLFLFQLNAGLTYQYYATNIGTSYFTAPMVFSDKLGEQICILSNYQRSGYLEYIKLDLTYPVEMLSIYLRHFINMMSSYFPGKIYVENVDMVKWPALVLEYTLRYFIFYDIVLKVRHRNVDKGFFRQPLFWAILVIIFPVFAIIPGAVENRFGIALYFLSYVYLFKYCSFRTVISHIKGHSLSAIGIYSIFLLLLIPIWSNTLSQLVNYPLHF